MPEQIEELEVRSEEVQEILGDIPHWIIRWGITSMFMILIMILIGAWFIEYPDTVTASVTLTTEDPPTQIIGRSSGAVQLFVSDREEVARGQFLGAIENSTTLDDALALIEIFNTIHPQFSSTRSVLLLANVFPDSLQLGNLQGDYQNLLVAVNEKNHFDELNRYAQETEAVIAQIKKYGELGKRLEKQVEFQRGQVRFAKRDVERDSILHALSAESLATFEATQSAYLQSLSSLEQAKAAVTRNEIQINDLKDQLQRTENVHLESIFTFSSSIDDRYERVRSALEDWKQKYLLISPINGIVTFNQFWQDGQFISTGEEVMTIVPQSDVYYARAELPLEGSGKVKPGNKVIIRFNNYPDQEYGTISGVVEHISLVPRENKYVINVGLEKGLLTSYDQELEFRQEMQGTADIVTEDLKLLERIFNNLRKLLSN